MKVPWWLKLEWRNTKFLLILCAIEFPITIAALTLFGIADPDTYRTSLWAEGASHGWNSDPIEILYSYANYKPIAAPVPWNQFTTDWNVVIVVLSMFILLAKTVLYITHVFPPIFSAIVHAILTIFYAISISRQAASDYSDPAFPSKVPWYLTRGCGSPVAPNLRGYCQQAKASVAVAVLLCTLFLVYTIFSIVSAIPTSTQRTAGSTKQSDIESPRSYYGDDKKWEFEMDRLPQTPGSPGFATTPMTPRTVAFNTLDGKVAGKKPNRDLPLRHHIAMGDETYQGARP